MRQEELNPKLQKGHTLEMNISEIAKEGLRRLKDGQMGINIDAMSEEDALYLINYFKSKGYDIKRDAPKNKESQIFYPVNIFNKSIRGNKNA